MSDKIPPKMRRLIEFLDQKGIPYEYDPPYAEGEPHIVRIYFRDVWEVMRPENLVEVEKDEVEGMTEEEYEEYMREKEYAAWEDVLISLASEIRGLGWDSENEDEWEEQSDRWLFFAW